MNNYKEISYKDYHKLSSKEGKYKIIRYDEDGNIEYEGYLINNKLHREDGPTVIRYYDNEKIWYEEYYINGKWHREDGPAYINYNNKNGNIDYEQYWLCDKSFTKEDFYSQKIKAILDIAKDMDVWESKYNFIKLSLKKELNE